MKLNNKGVTLIELLVSVVLLTVVMGFMYKLLLDITNMQNNDFFASNNQLKRNEIIKTIQKDLTKNGVEGTIVKSTSGTKTTLTYSDKNDKAYVITVQNNNNQSILEYNSNNEKTYKWVMTDCTLDYSNIMVANELHRDITIGNIHINVYTDNDANSNCTNCKNNLIDDIDLRFISNN